jgi:hypothetical protein
VVLAAAGLLAALAILASACGGGGSNNASGSSSGGSSSKTTSAADSAQQSGIAYAQCMRAHGVTNYPDNAITTSGGATKVNLPSGITSNPDYKSASQACQSKLPKGANGGGASGGSSNVNAVIKFANCMRSHGVTNFPEPNSSGQEIISGSGGVDPNSPTYQSAMTACKSLLPNGGSGAAG